LTDGYSVSFQITKEEGFSRKKKFKQPSAKPIAAPIKPKNPDSVEKKVTEFISTIDNSAAEWWDRLEDGNQYRLLSVDPGKNDIAAVSDGVRTLRYTKGQRDENTVKKVRMVHSSKLRKKHKVIGTYEEMKDPSIHDFESKFMSETCKKSSYQRFREYWKRHRILLLNQNLYEKAYFRQAKFMVYCKTKSSETKFFNKVEKMFLPPRPETTKIPASIKSMDALVDNSMGLKNKIVVGWGNWGRSPNLKGSAPTPGIGFRRRAQKRFQTVTVDEHFTSQDCPCCGERKLENPKIGKEQVSKHHLLHSMRLASADGGIGTLLEV
jgi:hypothetical protein